MRVCFVFQDPEILTLLHERKDCIVIRARPGEPLPDAELFIWDFEPSTEIPARLLGRESCRHLLLTERKCLSFLSPNLLNSTCILLKPVSAVTLNTFVDLAIEAWGAHQFADDANALRRDREALLQYVLEVNLKLQEYDHERTNFLARAFHDFRSPLTTLHGYCGLLAEEKLGSLTSEQRDLLQRMQHSTNRLARLASSTFELTISGQVQRQAIFASNNIDAAVNQALHDVSLMVTEKNIEVDVRLDPPGRTFSFESESIEQLLVNLLENSCKFVPRKGLISVRGYPVSWTKRACWSEFSEAPADGELNAYRIDILDSGPGVLPDEAEKIFDQYTSYVGPDDRSSSGLGLAICKLVVNAHHGTIWAAPGDHGGQFSFILPFNPVGRETGIFQDATHMNPKEAVVQ